MEASTEPTPIDPQHYEATHVREVYEKIAPSFDRTRHSVWKSVREYVSGIPETQTIVEVGCGNGKNLFRPRMKGYDNCQSFVDICQAKGLDVSWGDGLAVPVPDGSFDHAMSIAVIHHFSTEDRRLAAVRELVRLIRPGGTVLIVVWALDTQDEKNKKKRYEKSDVLVAFGSDENERYYHLFVSGELEGLCKKIPGVTVSKTFYEMGNYGIVLTKNS